MGKLHEVIACEPQLKEEAASKLKDASSLFTQGQQLLVGQVRTYKALEEGGEEFAPERTELATTVDATLGEVQAAHGAYMNAAIEKEVTNQSTNADVVVDGKKVLEGLPATALLNLEARLSELRSVYDKIPINTPTEKWVWDEQLGCWVSPEKVTYKSRKVMRSHVAYEATKEHPAQVQTFTEDVRAGQWTGQVWSGMLSPVDRRERLARLDKLILAVKKARQRANDIDVVPKDVAGTIFNYINKGSK